MSVSQCNLEAKYHLDTNKWYTGLTSARCVTTELPGSTSHDSRTTSACVHQSSLGHIPRSNFGNPLLLPIRPIYCHVDDYTCMPRYTTARQQRPRYARMRSRTNAFTYHTHMYMAARSIQLSGIISDPIFHSWVWHMIPVGLVQSACVSSFGCCGPHYDNHSASCTSGARASVPSGPLRISPPLKDDRHPNCCASGVSRVRPWNVESQKCR